ncbi:MAG: Sec-independent protein translocase subunit TatC, partial [Steroidobacter sp.]
MELRDRLVRVVIAIAVLFVPCAIFSKRLFTLIA